MVALRCNICSRQERTVQSLEIEIDVVSVEKRPKYFFLGCDFAYWLIVLSLTFNFNRELFGSKKGSVSGPSLKSPDRSVWVPRLGPTGKGKKSFHISRENLGFTESTGRSW